MATLRNFRGKWYARSRWSKNGNKIEKLIQIIEAKQKEIDKLKRPNDW